MELQTQQVDFDDISQDLGAISVMGPEGDTKHIWNPRNVDEVEAARELYENLVAKGYRAFRLTWIRTRGTPMHTFNPKAGQAVFVAPRKKADDTDGEMMTSFDPAEDRRVVAVPPFAGG